MYDRAQFSTNQLVAIRAPAPCRVDQRFYRRTGKRLFDIAFVLAMLPFLVPLVGVLALLVRRDGGPAFFTQERIGQGGIPFRCFKLRSMVPDSDHHLARVLGADPAKRDAWERKQKLADDPRVTRLGSFLRKSSLDELPQFFNVLRGEMSIVGPRPFLPEQETRYRLAGGLAYFNLRPGITGPWQVGSRNRATFEERVGYDEAYREAVGLAGDLRTILKTVVVVLRATGL